MPQYPEMQTEDPVLSPVDIAQNAGGGYDALAKSLGLVAQTAETEAEKVGDAESKSMYINSVANLKQLETTSQMRILQDPGNADRIMNDMQSATNTVKQMAYVNDHDRAELNSAAANVQDTVDLKGTEAQVMQSRLSAAFTHFANWPDQLKAYQDSLTNNPDQSESIKQGMLSNIRSLVLSRALTPEQAASNINMIGAVTDSTNDLHKALSMTGLDAQKYQTLQANPLNGTISNAGTPINGNTQWLINHNNSDMTFQGVLSDISNRKFNPEAFTNLTDVQRQRAMLSIQGVMDADGMINSGQPFSAIQAQYKDLTTRGDVLSYREQATRNALGAYVNNLKNGNFLSVIGQTPMGGSIMQNYTARNAAIENSAMDNNQKTQQLLQNKNDFTSQAISIGQALHLPGDIIKPVDSGSLATMQNGFKLGQDAQQTLSTFFQYNKQNQPYVANSMDKPAQRLILQACGYASNSTRPQDMIDFVTANQDGRQSSLDLKANNVKEEDLKNQVYSALKDQLGFVGKQYDFDQAQIFQKGMVQSTLNYANYLAAKDDNLTPTSSAMKDYINQAANIYKNAFNKVSSTNYVVNQNQLPPSVGKPELDNLAAYITNQGYSRLQQGRSPELANTAAWSNPLTMRWSSTNDVQAVDGNGNVYYSVPFNSNLVSAAKSYVQKAQAARMNQIKETELNQWINPEVGR